MGVFASGTTVLDEEHAWRLLRGYGLGRLVVVVDGEPEVFPVNYAITDRSSVVFRTAPGSKLAALTVSPRVAFEVDQLYGDQAWSVVVRGRARLHTESGALDFADDLAVHPFVRGERYEVVEITADSITARGFGDVAH